MNVKFKTSSIYALVLACLAGPCAWASFAGNIDATDKYAWAENAGWHNYVPTHGGVTVYPDGANGYLAGYAWAESVGWIKFGVGAGPYANTAANNYGVNLDAAGNLSGYAWSENSGWINFNPTHSQVTINLTTGRFSDYAWSEFCGWINFKNDSPAYNVRAVLDPPTPQPPSVPVGVSASSGTYTDKVSVTWNSTANATSYQVWRHTSNNSGGATQIATPTGTSYDDTTATASVTYYYWVKAVNAAGASGFSAADTGYLGVEGPLVSINNMIGDNVRIPAGTPITIAVEMMNLPASYIGHVVDWWVAAWMHEGDLWFYLNSDMVFTPFDGNLENMYPAYTGALGNLPRRTVAQLPSLSPGIYNVWFAVSYPPGYVINIADPNTYMLSRLTLTVE